MIAFGECRWWEDGGKAWGGLLGRVSSGGTSNITTDATEQRQESAGAATLVRAAITALVIASRAFAIACGYGPGSVAPAA